MGNLAAGIYSQLTVTANGCVSNIAGPFILNNPAPPAAPVIISKTPLCAGTTLSLSTTTTFPGAVYSWTGPMGFTSNQQNPSISNANIRMSGQYKLAVARNGCISAPTVFDVIFASI